MGSKIAVTDNGIHKIGKKMFLTDEDLVHRKAKKAFLTKDGVHKLVYSSGDTWEIYDAVQEPYYERVDSHEGVSVGDRDTYSVVYMDYLSSVYDFNESEGLQVGNNKSVWLYDSSYAETAVGYYIGDSSAVWQIVSLDNFYFNEDGYGCADYTIELVALAVDVGGRYVKGSTYYGTIDVEEGVRPDAGEIIDNYYVDDDGEYLIILVDGDYYCYFRGD